MWAGGGAKSREAKRPKKHQGVRGTGGAHSKHVRHGGDAGRVEAQRLVERARVLPSQKEGILGRRHVGRLKGASVWAGCNARREAGEGRASEGEQGVQGSGGTHIKHVLHGGDAGCVEAQRLVERRRTLSSKEGRRGRPHTGWEARACGRVAV